MSCATTITTAATTVTPVVAGGWGIAARRDPIEEDRWKYLPPPEIPIRIRDRMDYPSAGVEITTGTRAPNDSSGMSKSPTGSFGQAPSSPSYSFRLVSSSAASTKTAVSSLTGSSESNPILGAGTFMSPQQPKKQSPQPSPTARPAPPPPPPPAPPRPLYPHKTTDVPKAALHALYGKPPRRKVLEASDYITWNNQGPSHDLQWSSLFICPITAEVFLTRPFRGAGTSTNSPVERDGCIWYKKKSTAEHGAAATAYDCFMYRQMMESHPDTCGGPFTVTLADSERPYLMEHAITDNLPPGIPSDIRDLVQQKRSDILNPHLVGEMMEDRNVTTGSHTMEMNPNEMAWSKHPGDLFATGGGISWISSMPSPPPPPSPGTGI